jgi:Got1/Sft2-like family
MNYRSPMSKGSEFSSWLSQQKNAELVGDVEEGGTMSLLGPLTFSAMQDGLMNQVSVVTGSLPDPAAFRNRIKYVIYLLGISIIFALLAVFIGLPTLVLRPAKFVICMTLCTLSAAGSVIVLQAPSVFCSNLLKGGLLNALPVILLLFSMIFTIYATIFVHKYIIVIFAGAGQLLCLAFYLASFIPRGSKGLIVLLRMGYVILSTAMMPCIYAAKKSALTLLRTVMS